MAATYNSYTADGSTTTFAVSFTQYVYTSLLVSVNGVETTGYTYNDVDKTITITSPVLVAGDTVLIRRITDLDILYKFAQGAAFTGAHLDADILQAFSAVEEARDYSGLIGYSLGDNLNARNYRIYNLGDGVNPQDAVNLRQLQAQATSDRAYTDAQLTRTLRTVPTATFTSLQAPASLKGRILYFDSNTGQPAPAFPGTIEEADFLSLQDIDGEKYIGTCPDFATLRTVVPSAEGQTITLREYTVGTGYGGGKFRARSGSWTDDGGQFARVSAEWAWERVLDSVAGLNVVHFGAIPDGTTDCAPAVALMATRSRLLATQDNRIGVQFPPGEFAMSTYVYTSAVSYFRIASTGTTSFGYFAPTRIKLIGADGSIAFDINARRFELWGVTILGQNNVDAVVRHFVNNRCEAGEYFHAINWTASYMSGRTFSMLDTLDTKFSEFYASYCSQSILYALMSGNTSGTWDHTTAIELSNFNIQYHQGTQSGEDAIFLPRATQAIIHNGWIEHSAYPGNISEGQWIIDQLSLEGNSQPVYAQYAKTHERHINVQGGSAGTFGIAHTQGAVGNINGVTRPSWVTSAYEQGYIRQQPFGIDLHGSLAYEFLNSANRFTNMAGTTAWCRIGRLQFPATGASAVLRVVGTGGFDSASATPRPNGTAYGGGEAFIRVQAKADTGKVTVSWHGEDSCPILQVRYVNTSTTAIDVYVQLRAYTYAIAAFVDTDSTSRYQAGVRFYWLPDMSAVADINSVTTLVAPATLAFGAGGSDGAFGMDFDAKLFALETTLSTTASSTWLPVQINGNTYYVQVSGAAGRSRMASYAMADLPAPSSDIRTMYAWCTGMTASPTAAPVYCDGSTWRRFSDATAVS